MVPRSGSVLSGGVQITVAFGLVAVIAAALLGAAILASTAGHDWHAAVTIDGAPIGRADFRDRSAVLNAISLARTKAATRLAVAGFASIPEQSALEAAAAVRDPVTATVDSLVRERVVRDEAAAAGIPVPAVDVWAELAAAAYEPTARHVRWFVIGSPIDPPVTTLLAEGWSAAPGGGATAVPTLDARAAAMTSAASLLATTPVAGVVGIARSAGWDARGGEAWISDRGQVASIPDVLVTALRDPALPEGAVVGPLVDEAGAQGLAGVLVGLGPTPDAEIVRASLGGAAIEESWLRPWAEGRAIERLLEASKVETWITTPSRLVRGREIVVSGAGISGGSGPYAGLAHLVVDQLPAALLPSPDVHVRRVGGSPAHVLARRLRVLAPAERAARWDELVAAANGSGVSDHLRQSGEMGWSNAERMAPELAAAALADLTAAGSIIGPITTAAGPELFLVRGRYPGTLDERASAALTELLTSRDIGAVARRIAPRAEGMRFDAPIVRSERETFGNDQARAALFSDPLDTPSRPFVLGGEILLAIPLERTSEVPSGQTLARIRAAAFEAWLAERAAKLRVDVDPDPYGVVPPASSPSPASAAPTVPPMPTPFVPAIPGASQPPAGASDPFALPTIALGRSFP